MTLQIHLLRGRIRSGRQDKSNANSVCLKNKFRSRHPFGSKVCPAQRVFRYKVRNVSRNRKVEEEVRWDEIIAFHPQCLAHSMSLNFCLENQLKLRERISERLNRWMWQQQEHGSVLLPPQRLFCTYNDKSLKLILFWFGRRIHSIRFHKYLYLFILQASKEGVRAEVSSFGWCGC